MPGLLNLLNNPLALLVVLAGTWYTTKDFIAFTAVIMAFVSIQVALEKIVNNKVPKFLFASWLLLMPLGAMTLVFRDPAFLQWKFSVVHWLFGVILIGSRLIGKMDILKLIFSAAGTQLNNVEDIIWKLSLIHI